MLKFLLFLGYLAIMLGMTYVLACCALGSFRLGWRYMGTLVRHIAGLAAAGIVIAAIVTQLQ